MENNMHLQTGEMKRERQETRRCAKKCYKNNNDTKIDRKREQLAAKSQRRQR